MPQTDSILSPLLSDQQVVRKFFFSQPMVERVKPVITEMVWALLGSNDPGHHAKILPHYCYNIFEVFQRTLFKGFPLLSETTMITDQSALPLLKTINEAKKIIRLDWKNLGKLLGITTRCLRFTELELPIEFRQDDAGDSTPEETEDLFAIIFGRQWVYENRELIQSEPPNQIFSRMLNQQLAFAFATVQSLAPTFSDLACQWSPAAISDFCEGFAEGLNSFIDADGQFAGESSRTGIYGFLLLVWPEIKVMLESDAKKTLSDLHEWMKPFMRRGIIAYIDIETFRDVCAPSPSGIGLVLRPLKSFRSAPPA